MVRIRFHGRALALLLPILIAAPATAADTAEARARRLADEFLAGWTERHPEEATRLGDHTGDRRLPLLSAVALAADAAWYRAQRESLDALPMEGLPAGLRDDLRLARIAAARRVRELERERLHERDPGYALEPLRVALTGPMRSLHASACARSVDLRDRLRAVPEYLRDARIVATRPERPAVEHALDRVDALLALCRVDLPEAFASCREARLQADLAVADSLATQALSAYARHLRVNLLPAAGAAMPIGADVFAARLEDVAGGPVALPALLARARAEWERVAAARVPAPAGDAVRIEADSANALLESMRRELRRAGEWSADPDRIEATDRPAPRTEGALVTLGSWDPRGPRARLDFGPAPGTDPGDGALAADPMGSRESAELALAREGVPGRAAWAAVEAREGSRLRQALGLAAVRDGWSRVAERIWLRTAPAASRETTRRWVDALERERLARAIAELMPRVEGATLDEVAGWLERGAGLAAPAARLAAREAAGFPQWAASTLALWKLEEAIDRERERAGGRFDAAAFHAALAGRGAVPLAWFDEPRADAAAAGRERRP